MQLDGSKAKQLLSLSHDLGIDKGIAMSMESQPLQAAPLKCEGKMFSKGWTSSAPKQIEHNGERCQVPERIT